MPGGDERVGGSGAERRVRAAAERVGREPRAHPASTAARLACRSVPACEPHASAISAAPKPKWSAAPLSISGSACKRLDRRARIDGRSTSPSCSASAPEGAATATAPRCQLSTSGPRVSFDEDGIRHDLAEELGGRRARMRSIGRRGAGSSLIWR